MEDRVRALGEIAGDVLQRMVREQLARKPGGHLLEAALTEVHLDLPLALRGADADPAVFSGRLVEWIDRLLDDEIQRAAVFRPGHAFCHRCGGASCEHSFPPSGRHVFVGYAPTGMPRWEDFAQVCLDLRHPEVDRLYEEPPAFLTLVQDAATLRGNLLDAFQAPTYDLLGQVVAGFFQVRAREGEGRGVLAVTFQVAVSRPGATRLRLGLNILGRTSLGEPLELLWDRHDDVPWTRAARWAQGALATVVRRAPRARNGLATTGSDLERRVEGILRGLARRLEHDQRGRARRTHHAEERHRSGERPTRKALDDIREARAESILVDERNGTLVVPGERGRIHFFTADGKLVSSVRYGRDAIERKRKLGLWRDAAEPEAEALLKKLRGRASEA
jgi:hypothetical protein